MSPAISGRGSWEDHDKKKCGELGKNGFLKISGRKP